MTNAIKTGQLGEQIAAKYLISKGYTIIVANQRQGHKEIDLIANLGTLTVFIEVKTANSLSQIKPEEMISSLKIHKLKRAMCLYCREQRIPLRQARLDLLAISLNFQEKMAKIKHFKNIFG